MRGNIKHEKIFLQKFYFDMALDLTLGIYDFAVKFFDNSIVRLFVPIYLFRFLCTTIRH